mgnify:CR=1 FL=1
MLGKRRHFSQWSQVAADTPNSAAARLIGMARRARQIRNRPASNTPAERRVDGKCCFDDGMTIPEKKKGRELQVRASPEGPRSPTKETQSKKPRPGGALPPVSFLWSKIRGFQVKQLLR